MEKQIIRLLCLDIDGTVLDSHHRVPSANKEALREAAQAGVTIYLLSARPPAAVVPILRELDLENNMVCYNGGLILHNDRTISEERIPMLAAQRIVQEAKCCGVHLSVYRNWDWFVETHDAWSKQESDITGIIPTATPLGDTMQEWQDGAHKFLCMGEPEQINKIYDALNARLLPVQLVRSKDTYLEILPLCAEKGIALQSLCALLHIPQQQTMAVGDHDNDCGMLRAAGIGIAMGNGSAAAKAAADAVTGSNDEAGVSEAVRKWILHR